MPHSYINFPMEEVIKEYLSGMSLVGLGEKYGVSANCIRARLKVAKIKPPIFEIIKDYESGMTLVEVGEKYGVSVTTIRNRLKEAGVKKIPAKERNRLKSPLDEIIKYYESGMTTTELGEWYGVSDTTIRNRLKEAGVEIISHPFRIKIPLDEIIKDYQSGMSTTELGERYGVGANVINERLRRAGVKKISALERNRLKFPLEQVIKDYESGMTSTEVGKKYGYDGKTITTRLREVGVQIRKRGFGGINKAKKEKLYGKIELPLKVIKEYKSGMTLVELGEKYGCSWATIRARLTEAGVQILRRKRWDDVLPLEQITSEYESGMSMYQLGKKYGCDASVIKRRLRKAGVQIRKRGPHTKKEGV